MTGIFCQYSRAGSKPMARYVYPPKELLKAVIWQCWHNILLKELGLRNRLRSCRYRIQVNMHIKRVFNCLKSSSLLATHEMTDEDSEVIELSIEVELELCVDCPPKPNKSTRSSIKNWPRASICLPSSSAFRPFRNQFIIFRLLLTRGMLLCLY